MTRLLTLLTVTTLLVPAPALAQMLPSLSLDASSDASGDLSRSAPPDYPSLSIPDDEESEEPSEPAAPPMASADALKLFVTTCSEIAGGDPKGLDDAAAAGWLPDDPEDTGPYVTIYSGYQDLSGYGTVDLWSSFETFPTKRLGYCRVDFSDSDAAIDFDDMLSLGLTGETTKGDGDTVFGAWESADHSTLISASRQDGAVQMEFNVVLGPAATNT